MLEKLRAHGVIIAIVAAGVLLRLWGAGFGLPRLYDPDEWHWVVRALIMLRDRDPNPHWFGHPGTTIMYALAVIYAAIFVIRLAAGSISSAEEFGAFYYRDPTVFYLGGRLLIVLCGTATIVAVYLIARRLGSRKTGLLAAAVLALSPLHVLYSKLIRGDVPIGLLMLIALWFCLNILENRRWRDYLAAGFVTGLAIATKYTAAIFLGSIALAHLEAIRWEVHGLRKHDRLLGSAVACLVGTFLGSPFVFLDFRTALSDFIQEARPIHLSATGEGFLRNLLWYLRGPLPGALTLLGLVLAGLGMLCFFSSGRKEKRLAASVPILYLLFISCLRLRWDHWIVPTIPFLCVLLAHATTLVEEWAGRRFKAGLSHWLGLGLGLLVAMPLLRADLAQGQALTRADTRTLAEGWMLANLPPGSHVLMESNTPQPPKDSFTFFTVGNQGNLVRVDPRDTNYYRFFPTGRIGFLRDPALLAEERVRYVVMSNFYDRYLAEEERYPDVVRGYRRVIEGATLIHEIPGCKLESAYQSGGPPIRIYEIE